MISQDLAIMTMVPILYYAVLIPFVFYGIPVIIYLLMVWWYVQRLPASPQWGQALSGTCRSRGIGNCHFRTGFYIGTTLYGWILTEYNSVKIIQQNCSYHLLIRTVLSRTTNERLQFTWLMIQTSCVIFFSSIESYKKSSRFSNM